MSLAPLPPFALAPPTFPFRHLVGFAGRAPIGGAREVALACYVAARLARDYSPADGESRELRHSRSAGAKAWFGTLALPVAVKTAVTRCAETTVDGSSLDVAREVTAVAAAASTYLDQPSRIELEGLAASLRA